MTSDPRTRRPQRAAARGGRAADGTGLAALREALRDEVAKVVVGQEDVVDRLLGAVVVGGHVLLEGVPGVAKTLLARAFAAALGIEFRRAQCTPDMLPADLTGTMILVRGELVFRPGPVFTNVLLTDEVNRTPPKTQSALLESMQERQVTVDGVSHPLPDPFLVIATQNPLEFDGTYPLPEAQLDRFHVKVTVGYPAPDAELAMLRLAHHGVDPATLDDVDAILDAAMLRRMQAAVDEVRAADEVIAYAAAVARATRTLPSIAVGASPRAIVHLLAAARANAALAGRSFVTPDDVASVAVAVLAHRLQLRPEAELERYTTAAAVEAALGAVEVPR